MLGAVQAGLLGAGGAFNPLSLSPLLWCDFSDASLLFTDAGSTNVSADADAIYQANDKSGNGFNLVQSTLTKRPLYKTSTQNGLSSGLFASVLKSMLIDGISNAASDYTFIFAMSPDTLPTAQYDSYFFDTQSGRLILTHNFDTPTEIPKTQMYDGTWRDFSITPTYDAQVMSFVLSSTAHVYRNGSASLGNAPYTQKAIGGTTALMSRYSTDIGMWNGSLYEVLIYNSALSATDRGLVEEWLNNKWSIY